MKRADSEFSALCELVAISNLQILNGFVRFDSHPRRHLESMLYKLFCAMPASIRPTSSRLAKPTCDASFVSSAINLCA